MSHVNSEGESDRDPGEPEGASIELPLPVRSDSLFKHGATPYVLNFLGDNPDIDVSIRQLSQVVPMSERSTRQAVDALEAADLVGTVREGNARRIHINRSRLRKPDDPIRSIPQANFQTPVRVARHYVEDELDGVVGVVLFGSVARGDADRRSDVDLWVLVTGDHMQQRHAANKLANRLDDIRIPSTIGVADATTADFDSEWATIRERLEDGIDDPSAQRYSFEIIVETPGSIVGQADRVNAEALFGEGITLLSTEALERVKREVLRDG